MTTGGTSDSAALTDIATGVVTRWGMSSFGFLRVAERPGAAYQERVTDEIRTLAAKAMRPATEMWFKSFLDTVASRLLQQDSIHAEQLADLVAAHRICDTRSGQERTLTKKSPFPFCMETCCG